MTRPQNVPGTDNGNVHSAGSERRFTFRAHSDIALHYRRGLGNAQIDEVLNSGLLCQFYGTQGRDPVNCLEFCCFRRTGMRNADWLHERLRRLNLMPVRSWVNRIAEDCLAATGSFFSLPCRTSARTWCPRSTRARVSGVPRYPVPPVTKTESVSCMPYRLRKTGGSGFAIECVVVRPKAPLAAWLTADDCVAYNAG